MTTTSSCSRTWHSKRLIGKKIHEVKIIPLYKGRAFKIAYCYEVDEQDLKLNCENSLAIDIGLDNLATCVTNFGTSFIMNPDFKRGINLGAKINQQFTQISFGALRRQLKNLCARYGMSYVEQEESYTSKASFLDLDFLPVYDAETPYTGTFSGKRIKRGLYKSGNGKLINADVNGAANILRKSKQRLDLERLCMGFLDNPLRIRGA